MSYSIDSNLEFCEIINAFPIIGERLKQLNFDVDNFIEGESMRDFFLRNDILEDEAEMIEIRLNSDLKYYLKNGELPRSVPFRDEREVLLLDDD